MLFVQGPRGKGLPQVTGCAAEWGYQLLLPHSSEPSETRQGLNPEAPGPEPFPLPGPSRSPAWSQ